VFRADSPEHTGLKHILIQLVLYIRDLLSFDCGWEEKFNVKYDLANFQSQKINLLVHTRVPLTYGDIFANYLNPTIKTQKVFYTKNQTDPCKFW